MDIHSLRAEKGSVRYMLGDAVGGGAGPLSGGKASEGRGPGRGIEC